MNKVVQSGSRTSVQRVRPQETLPQPVIQERKAKAVRGALLNCPEEFTIYNVEEVLKMQQDRPPLKRVSISQALHDFARSGEIFIKTPSYGRRAAVYCKSRPLSRLNVADLLDTHRSRKTTAAP